MSFVRNVKKAFEGVKRDVIEVKDQILGIAERLEHLEAMIEELKKKENNLVQIGTPKKASKKKAAKN